MYEAVIFDKDGVLVNSEPELDRRRRAFFAEEGIDDSGFPDFYGSNNKVVWGCVEPHDVERRERLYKKFRTRFANNPMPYAELAAPGVRETLSGLRQAGVRTGLASASPRWVIDGFVEALGIGGLLDVTVSGEECAASKPAPDVYLRTMELLGVEAGQTLVVEDSPIGILAAHRSGARVCAMPLPEGVHLDQSLADVHLSGLTDVLALALS
ncbi:MAG TPA: HAD family phosphatase [Candidatus Olsenella pullicola]|nr:HAD family phosphatase [Candidatus Olsenella pullicola]